MYMTFLKLYDSLVALGDNNKKARESYGTD